MGIAPQKRLIYMKFSLHFLMSLLLIGLLAAPVFAQEAPADPPVDKIEWLSFEEAVERNTDNQKLIFIDVYTEWCGWCKRMDQTTFSNPEVVATMNQYFHAVKFDAEQKDSIVLGETVYRHRPGGRNGVHELAVALLQNKLSYPTVVFLDEGFNMIQPLPGYRTAAEMEPILAYIGSKAYIELEFEAFQATREQEATPEEE